MKDRLPGHNELRDRDDRTSAAHAAAHNSTESKLALQDGARA